MRRVLRITPWRRLFARYLDYVFFALLFVLLLKILPDYIYEPIDSLFTYSLSRVITPFIHMGEGYSKSTVEFLMLLFILLFIVFILLLFSLLFSLIEAVFISTMGTTPFKALLKIRILDKNRKKLSFANSLKRSFLVLFKGWGLGIFPIFIITYILSYIKLKTKRTTSWDQSAKSLAYCGRSNFTRSATATLLSFLFPVLLLLALSEENPNKMAENNSLQKECNFLKKTVSEKGKITTKTSETATILNSAKEKKGTNVSSLEQVPAGTALIVSCSKDSRPTGIGSGFFITNNLLVTNSHVVDNSFTKDKLKVVYIETHKNIRDIGYVLDEDKKNDLAIIKTVKNTHHFLSLGNYRQVKMGDEVFVLGSPRGYMGTLSKGIVSAKRIIKGLRVLQITAPISKGSSGSPVLSKDLKVVAIASSIQEDSQNINFAVPVTYLKKLIRENKKIGTLSTSNQERKSYKKNLDEYQKSAQRGDTKAQYNLGVIYKYGQDVHQNYKQAFYWFQKAGEQGHTESQYNLGMMYKKGQGVHQSYTHAAYWFQKAGEQGHTESQYNLGMMYKTGQGVHQSYTHAAYWFQKSSEKEHTESQYNLGMMYALGRGVPKDLTISYAYFDLAVLNGDKSVTKYRNKVVDLLSSEQMERAKRISYQMQQKQNQRKPASNK